MITFVIPVLLFGILYQLRGDEKTARVCLTSAGIVFIVLLLVQGVQHLETRQEKSLQTQMRDVQ